MASYEPMGHERAISPQVVHFRTGDEIDFVSRIIRASNSRVAAVFVLPISAETNVIIVVYLVAKAFLHAVEASEQMLENGDPSSALHASFIHLNAKLCEPSKENDLHSVDE